MNVDILLLTASISSIVGILAPFVVPFLFQLIAKILKRDLISEEKRLVITILAVLTSAAVIAANYKYSGDWKVDLYEIAQYFVVNFLAVKGMVQTIYELIIKGIPAIDKSLTKASECS